MTTSDLAGATTSDLDASGASGWDADRALSWAFPVLLAGVGVLLLWYGERQWFFLDEWSVLTDRPMPSLDSLLRSHNGHWIALNVVAYKFNFWLFGLHTYLPYQLPTVLLHLGIAFLLRRTMMRYGVRNWIASFLALAFALFGTGFENIVSAFQISLNGSVFLGLIYLELVDRDGPWTRRDGWAMAVGFLCLTTSGVAIPMIAGATVAMLLRRGPVIAATHAVSLAAIYIGWYLAYATGTGPEQAGSPGGVANFVAELGAATADGLAQYAAGAAVLIVVFAVGLYAIGDIEDDRPHGVLALVAAYVTFAVLIGYSRIGEIEAAGAELDLSNSSRYRHVTAALLLPTVGLGAEWLARRAAVLALPVLGALVIGIPGNLETLDDRLVLGNERQIALLAYSEVINDVPPGHRPVSAGILGRQDITAGWLAGAAVSGKIDPPADPTPTERLTAIAALSVEQTSAFPRSDACTAFTGAVRRTLDRQTGILFTGSIRVRLNEGDASSTPARFDERNGRQLLILSGPLDLTIPPVNDSAALC
ncbi:MAG: hypothetical protein HKN26_16320 [Acidimicrobiales bacterium]|nr:hypothetical protein [Acidimicrobiales bacterium]